MRNLLRQLWAYLLELRRRKVYRVAALYAAVAFVIWQVAAVLVPALLLPPWMLTLVVVLAILGFPVAVMLAWAFEITPDGIRRTSNAEAASRPTRVLVVVSGILVLLGAVWFSADRLRQAMVATSTTSATGHRTRSLQGPAAFTVPVPNGQVLENARGLAVAISPDGRRFVYVARTEHGSLLYVRAIGRLEATPLPGTRNAISPFFSPDGQWIAFFAGGHLRRVAAAGGRPVDIADIAGLFTGASWGSNDTVYYGQWGTHAGIYRVGAFGGPPELLAAPLSGESTYSWPSRMPGGAILFAVLTGGDFDATRIEVVDPVTRARKMVLEEGNFPRYSSNGYLLYGGAATEAGITAIRAVGFDPSRLETLGATETVVDSVMYTFESRAVQFGISTQGTLVYVSPRGLPEPDTLEWVGLDGSQKPLRFAPPAPVLSQRVQRYHYPALSPDARLIGMTFSGEGQSAWVLDPNRSILSPVAPGSGNTHITVWSPRGDRLVFASDQSGGAANLYLRWLDDRLPVQRLTRSEQHQDPASWSRDGRYLTFDQLNPETGWDIYLLDMASLESRALIRSRFRETHPMISPDARWLAYSSNASGRVEVYVRSFPAMGRQQQVSTAGGTEPVWSRDGKELFYTSSGAENQCPGPPPAETDPESPCIMGVTVAEEAGTLRFGRPQRLVTRGSTGHEAGGPPRYDVAADGRRFLVVRGGRPAPGSPEFVVLLDWAATLAQRKGSE
jgi:Tol biopolymer transport system component